MTWPIQKYDYISVPMVWQIQDITEIMKYANDGWRLVTIIKMKSQYPYAIFEKVKIQ